MFLNELSAAEKENFMSLAVNAAKSNDELADEEYLMLQEYCREMGLPYFDASTVKPLDEIVDTFKKSSSKVKKIVVFELLGLLVVDGDFDNKERAFFKEFYEKLGVSEETVIELNNLLDEYSNLMRKISDKISE